MSESEHPDSEFYYPGELSDAEMLQLTTHNEATESHNSRIKKTNARETKQCCHERVLFPPKNENEKKMVIW